MSLLRLIDLQSGTWKQKVSIDIDEGEVIVLLGRNGAGKTTFLNTVAGLLTPTSGKIIFRGMELSHSDIVNSVNAGIRIALEGRQIFSRLSVKKNLLLGAYTQKHGDTLASDLKLILEIFPDLNEKLNELAVNLSGGQQTQLNVARALMGNPRLLLLDEPTLGLDPRNTNKLIKILNLISKEQGVSIVIAEQGVALAKIFDKRVLLMVGGEILFDGSWEEAKIKGELKSILPSPPRHY